MHVLFLGVPIKQVSQPKRGDIFIKKSNGCSHVGIVTGYNPETKEYTTIEGNTSNDTVQQLTRPINDAGLTGFGINTPSKSALKE